MSDHSAPIIGTTGMATELADSGRNLGRAEASRWILPADQAVTGPTVGEPAAAPMADRVLVADDNADMREYLRRLLAEHWNVEVVADGVAALEAARRCPPDLVLSDVMMPRLDGFELLRALRADPGTRGVPVILLSARAGEADGIEGLDAGADDYLVKPFTARELVARVRVHLELVRLRRESEREMRAVLESIADGFVAVDRDWRLTYVNRKAEPLVEVGGSALTAGKLIGAVLWDALPQLTSPEARTQCEKAMAGTTTCFDVEDAIGQRWLEVRAYPSERGLALYVSDVTERKRTDAALRHFIANAAHELRSPLGMLVATASLLGEGHDTNGPARLEHAIQIIARQGERAQTLVTDLLDLSRYEHDTSVELESVPLVAAAHDAMETLDAPVNRSVLIDIPDDLRVQAEPARLGRIFVNLLTNAYRYGGDTIRLRAEVTGENVNVVISDNGPGISPELVPHLFEPFTRGRGHGSDGSGLGLAIVRALVDGFGGDVGYEPGPEGGAQFVLRLARG